MYIELSDISLILVGITQDPKPYTIKLTQIDLYTSK
jgi:hypothetical protein